MKPYFVAQLDALNATGTSPFLRVYACLHVEHCLQDTYNAYMCPTR